MKQANTGPAEDDEEMNERPNNTVRTLSLFQSEIFLTYMCQFTSHAVMAKPAALVQRTNKVPPASTTIGVNRDDEEEVIGTRQTHSTVSRRKNSDDDEEEDVRQKHSTISRRKNSDDDDEEEVIGTHEKHSTVSCRNIDQSRSSSPDHASGQLHLDNHTQPSESPGSTSRHSSPSIQQKR